jgi:hypothetical protein
LPNLNSRVVVFLIALAIISGFLALLPEINYVINTANLSPVLTFAEKNLPNHARPTPILRIMIPPRARWPSTSTYVSWIYASVFDRASACKNRLACH